MNSGATCRGRLDTDPLTLNQLGAIHGAFSRLGFHISADRSERLRLTATLAQSPPLTSTKDLTMGQAGRAVRALAGCRTVNDLYSRTRPEPRGALSILRSWLAGSPAFVGAARYGGPDR